MIKANLDRASECGITNAELLDDFNEEVHDCEKENRESGCQTTF